MGTSPPEAKIFRPDFVALDADLSTLEDKEDKKDPLHGRRLNQFVWAM